MKYDDLFSAKDAREYLGLTVGQWNYIAHKTKIIKPIPIGERVYDDNDARHMTYLFSRRQLEELKRKIDAATSISRIKEPVLPLKSEIEQVFSVADAADYLDKSPEAVRMWMYRHGTPHKKIGNQTVFLLQDVKEMNDPYGLKAALAAHGMKEGGESE